jgi:sialate O-acetylesterase
MRFPTLLSALALVALPAYAAVTPHPLFADGAVLQRDQAIPIWGEAAEGETIRVEFAGHEATTTASKGAWRVELPALPAGGPHTLTITGENVVTLTDILLGDVWLCSGQSNMHFQMKSVENAAREISAMNHPDVRFFNVRQNFAQQPISALAGSWKPVTPENAASCPAVAGYFAIALNQHLGIPIGLINSSVGGTRIESWMRAETLAATGESRSLIETWHNMPPAEFARIGKAYAAFQYQRDHVHPKALAEARKTGAPLPPPRARPRLRCHDCPSALHNAMIAPLEPFRFRGFLWYQGESNAGQPGPYETLLPAMIADWRGIWGGDLPFLFVQIAPHKSIHPAFREAQERIWHRTARSAMVATTDVGNMENIHPAHKRPVGERLALAARALAYGENIPWSGPVFQSMEIEEDRAVLTFSHRGSGLVAREGGDVLRGFTLAGAEGSFVPAEATLAGDRIIVRAETIPAPAAVRYNWSKNPQGNLYNREGLPALPFRSDAPKPASQ